MNAAPIDRSSVSAAIPAARKDLYRLLLLRKNGSELLVAGERPPYTLPYVEIPRWERMAENLTAAVRKRYGISAICLFTPEVSASTTDGEQPLYQVLETIEAAIGAPDETRWLALDSIADESFADEQDLAAISEMSRQIEKLQSGEAIGPFGRPEWIGELFSWVQHEIERLLCVVE